MKRLLTTFLELLLWLIVPLSALADLDVYFLDVGQADAMFISCDEHTMMIDGGDPDDSQFIYSFLTKSMKVQHLDYVVATHPDDDHVGSLPAAFRACQVDTLFSTVEHHDSRSFRSILKYAGEQGTKILVPKAGSTYTLGEAVIQFLSPICQYDDDNDLSLVVRIVYEDTAFMFAGDATYLAQEDMIRQGFDLSADVLKIGHHGSAASTSIGFLAAVHPAYAVISVGKDNTYGHPAADTMHNLKQYDVTVYRTDFDGTILCSSNGKSISFTTEHDLPGGTDRYQPRNTVAPSPTDSPTEGFAYIGNKNTKKFHIPSCKSVNKMAEHNKVFLQSRDEAVQSGYSPCGNCHP